MSLNNDSLNQTSPRSDEASINLIGPGNVSNSDNVQIPVASDAIRSAPSKPSSTTYSPPEVPQSEVDTILNNPKRDVTRHVPSCCQNSCNFWLYLSGCFFIGVLVPIILIILLFAGVIPPEYENDGFFVVFAVFLIILLATLGYIIYCISPLLCHGLPCNTPPVAPVESAIDSPI